MLTFTKSSVSGLVEQKFPVVPADEIMYAVVNQNITGYGLLVLRKDNLLPPKEREQL